MHVGRRVVVLSLLLPLLVVIGLRAAPAADPPAPPQAGGELVFRGPDGAALSCPLRHTAVAAEITGHIARVEVTQVFGNAAESAIEAIYLFPLPNHAAVDDMEIRVGGLSVIRGVIKKKEEARAIYMAARRAGNVVALLDQDRPNIFRQSVANIPPGVEVTVRIRYVETLPYLEGKYEFTFPMVVAPRYGAIVRTPAAPAASGGPGAVGADSGDPDEPEDVDAPDDVDAQDDVDDPDDVGDSDDVDDPDEGDGSGAPAEAAGPGATVTMARPGHDISLEVHLDAGATARDLASPTHQVEVQSDGRGGDIVRLSRLDSIPNRDFILRYSLDAAEPRLVVLTHRGDKGGSFLALVQPGLEARPAAVMPKELIFVVDDSGSMGGAPIEQVRKAMLYALRNLEPVDTFQIIAFADNVRTFADAPVPATAGNVARAAGFVDGFKGDGGTILIGGVKRALSYPEDPNRMRIISFMTDGLIGDEAEILAYLEKHLGRARLFPMGVGSAPNRYLLDGMADFGRGAVEYVAPADESTAAVDHFYERIRTPVLTDVAIDWGGLSVSDVYPTRVPDLFAGQPVVLHGRYDHEGSAEVRLTGRLAGGPFERTLHVAFPPRNDGGEAIETLWARARIADLSRDNGGRPGPEHVEKIVQTGLDYHLVTDYTSFVAVEERVIAGDGNPGTVIVPSECPAGMFCRDPRVLAEAIYVTSAPDVVDTESTTTSTTVSSEFIDALPILGRNYQDVLSLSGAPGVTVVNGALKGSGGSFSRAQGGSVKGAPAKAVAVSVEIDLARRSYRLDETIEVTLTIENHGPAVVHLPATMSVALGTAPFAIQGDGGRVPGDPALSTSAGEMQSILPGERRVVRILLNGPGGYRLDAGRYKLRFLGAPFGLPDSNVVTFAVRPD